MKQLTDIQKEWVAALRSGEYKQGEGRLRSGDARDLYCCLGVLCCIAEKHGHGKWVDGEEGMTFAGSEICLPVIIADFAGVKERFGRYGEADSDSLSSQNDNGATFAEIADLIEAKAEELFV